MGEANRLICCRGGRSRAFLLSDLRCAQPAADQAPFRVGTHGREAGSTAPVNPHYKPCSQPGSAANEVRQCSANLAGKFPPALPCDRENVTHRQRTNPVVADHHHEVVLHMVEAVLWAKPASARLTRANVVRTHLRVENQAVTQTFRADAKLGFLADAERPGSTSTVRPGSAAKLPVRRPSGRNFPMASSPIFSSPGCPFSARPATPPREGSV